MRRFASASAALVMIVLAAVPAAAQTDQDTISMTALHAIPGEGDFPADVYLDGELAIAGFTKMMRTDPFELDPGQFTVAIFAAGADPATATAAIERTIELSEPGNYVLVAHLADDGQPVIALYVNDLSPVPMGQGRLVFRQTAAVGAVDVTANQTTIAASLPNTGEVTVDLAAGVHSLQVVPAGGGEPLAEADVELMEGELTAVFAISTMEGDVVDLAVQTVTGLQSTPSSVPTGTGGDAAQGDNALRILLALAGVAAIGAGLHFARK